MAQQGHTLIDWRPEDPQFWAQKGRAIATRNLWISIPNLLLAFSVWMVWSVVVARLPAIGFDFDTNQLFWLAAMPGLSGATLRIFYSFVIPIFGGRLWTTLSSLSLLLPALGAGFAVQNPETSYTWFLILAVLCGFGGGNFASSMANIAYFYPKATKGNALALNAGLGNLGVSVMQFLVPIVITTGVFGAIGGEPQALANGGQLWLQNAGFVWVPFILISAVLAWFGMNDIAEAKASIGEQMSILGRFHNWVMCLLYTGTFGSFIGYSAGFPLLMPMLGIHTIGAAADPHPVPRGERAQLCLPRPAGRRAEPGRDGLGFGQVRRRARDLLGLRRHDRRGLWRHRLPAGRGRGCR